MTPSNSQSSTNIGVLLLFVCLLLVATTATGVLVTWLPMLTDETGGDQQQNGESFQVVGISEGTIENQSEIPARIGDAGENSSLTYELRVELKAASEDVDLDLRDLDVSITGDAGSIELEHASEGVGDDGLDTEGTTAGRAVRRGVYFIRPVSVTDPDPVLSDASDRYELLIPTGVLIDEQGAVMADPKVTNADGEFVRLGRTYEPADGLTVAIPSVLDSGEGYDNTRIRPPSEGDTLTLTVAAESGREHTVEFQAGAEDEE